MIPAGGARRRGRLLTAAFAVGLTLALVAACDTTDVQQGNSCSGQGQANSVACHQTDDPTTPAPTLTGQGGLTQVSMAMGSEDLAFFGDPRVVAEFKKQGLQVNATAGLGSVDLALRLNPKGYDAFFLSSQVLADVAENRLGPHPEYVPFSTQLEVFTWKPLLPFLRQLGIVNSAGQFDILQYLNVVRNGTTWRQIPGNTWYANPNQVLVRTTDPGKSNSGAMFISAAGYVLYTQAQHKSMNYGLQWISAVSPEIGQLISKEGEMPETTNEEYLDYRRGGENGAPLALGYQAEFQGIQPPAVGELPLAAVALPLDYPIACDHVVFALTGLGQRVGKLLASDPVLLQLAQQYGFDTGAAPGDPNPAFDITVPNAHYLLDLIDDADPNE